MKKQIAAMLLTLGIVGSAQAETIIESTPLFSEGKWVVEREHYVNLSLLQCNAMTVDKLGSSLNISISSYGSTVLYVLWGPSVELNLAKPEMAVVAIGTIDDRAWKFYPTIAKLEYKSISYHFEETEAALTFISQIAKGQEFTIMDGLGNEVGKWSLSGSYNSMIELLKCFGTISTIDINEDDTGDEF